MKIQSAFYALPSKQGRLHGYLVAAVGIVPPKSDKSGEWARKVNPMKRHLLLVMAATVPLLVPRGARAADLVCGANPCTGDNTSITDSTAGDTALHAENDDSTNASSYAFSAVAVKADAVHASSTDADGVFGTTGGGGSGDTFAGVDGDNSGSGIGVLGRQIGTTGIGVAGIFDVSGWTQPTGANYAVYGKSGGTGFGGYFISSTGQGVYATSASNPLATLEGVNTGGGVGAEGTSSTAGGIGVYGSAGSNSTAQGSGVYGTCTGTNGVGVFGDAGSTTSGTGVAGSCSGTGCWGGYFSGNVNVVSSTGGLYVNGTCKTGPCTSDSRLKQNITPLNGALERLLQLKGVTYEWKAPPEYGNETGTRTGFIAQEVEKVFPAWVHEGKNGFKTLDLDERALFAFQVEALRALKLKSDAQEERIKALEEARRPVVSMNANGLGFGVAGLAIAGALVFTRRKRSESRDPE